MNNHKYSDFDKMGKIRKEVKKAKHSKSSGPQKVTPGAAQGLVFNTSGYGQHILKNPQVVQSMVEKAGMTNKKIYFDFGLVKNSIVKNFLKWVLCRSNICNKVSNEQIRYLKSVQVQVT